MHAPAATTVARAAIEDAGGLLCTDHLSLTRSHSARLSAFGKADLGFRQTLDEAAGTPTLTDHLHVIRFLLQVYADRTVHDREQAERAIAEREAVLAGVRTGDEDTSASATAVHRATATARLLSESTG